MATGIGKYKILHTLNKCMIILCPLLTVSHSDSPVTGLVVATIFVVLLIMALVAVIILGILGR